MNQENLAPIHKQRELCALFPEGTVEIHQPGEENEEYRYLREGEVCLTIKSPGGEPLFLDLSDEFTLFFQAFHDHYDPDTAGYEDLLRDLQRILKNEACSGAVYWFSNGEKKWLGSKLVPREELSWPIKRIFPFIFQQKEFRQRLRNYGGEVRFSFWNPTDDWTVDLPR